MAIGRTFKEAMQKALRSLETGRAGFGADGKDEPPMRADGALDFLSLGALVHRLDPGIIPFRKATTCHIHVSGGEFNCAANLDKTIKFLGKPQKN
jgi:hypothetical protein